MSKLYFVIDEVCVRPSPSTSAGRIGTPRRHPRRTENISWRTSNVSYFGIWWVGGTDVDNYLAF